MLALVAPSPPVLSGTDADVRAALAGEPDAVGRLVARHEAGLRAVTRLYRLSPWDADDVIQMTWLQFLEHRRSVREPSAVGGWLMTTARRLSLRALQRHVRELPDPEPALDQVTATGGPEAELLDAERRAVITGALRELPDRPRALMRLLVAEPDLSYEEISRRLDMPVGSIGPIRARSLARLRRQTALCALHAAD